MYVEILNTPEHQFKASFFGEMEDYSKTFALILAYRF